MRRKKMPEVQKWIAKKKADIVLQIFRQNSTFIDVAWQNDLTPSEVQEWVDSFVKGEEKSLSWHCTVCSIRNTNKP